MPGLTSGYFLTNDGHLVQSRREAVGMVGPRAGRARDEVLAGLLAANEAVLDPGGLVDALVAEPVPIRNLVDARLEAVSVVALVAAGREKIRLVRYALHQQVTSYNAGRSGPILS